MKSNISNIVKHNLCHGCGGCKSICPTNAINLQITRNGLIEPIIDDKLCTKCGLCLSVCSGKGFDFGKEYDLMFGEQPKDPWLGVYKSLETNHATDENLRFNASSGGTLTAIILYLLDNKIIDGAIVTKFSDENPLIPHVFIAKTKEDVLQSIGSKYCPVPTNSILEQLKKVDGKYAFVGLPCHLHTLRNYLKIDKSLNDKIFITLGLMCVHTNTFNGTKYFLRNRDINIENIKSFSYRGNGWLGGISVNDGISTKFFNKKSKNLKEQQINYISFTSSFVPKRCLVCCDHLAEFSDISFGDPRHKDYLKNEKIGKSLLVIRTEKALEIVIKMYNENILLKDKVLNIKEFYKGQNIHNKVTYKSHIILNKLFLKKNPYYFFKIPKKSAFSLSRIIKYIPSYFSQFQKSDKILNIHYILSEKYLKPKYYIKLIRKK